MGWTLPPHIRARCVSSMAAGDATKPAKASRATRGTGPVSRRKRATARRLCEMRVEGGDTVVIPVRTVTEGNAKENPFRKAKRAERQRGITAVAMATMRRAAGGALPAFPVEVLLTRMSPGKLDAHDNLPGSLKHVVDEIAEIYGVDDGDPRWLWRYDQERGKEHGVRVRIRSLADG